ncbi:hypothetical protein ACNKHP_26115 [Shigella boydii]
MEIEEDLVEEVVRVYGYNNIPDAAEASLITGHLTVKLTCRSSA